MRLGDHSKALGYCTFCPKLCRFSCPVAEAESRETVTPWFKMSLAELVRLGRQEAGGDVGEVFLHCLGCLHCRTHCKHEIDVPAALTSARAASLEAGGEQASVTALLDLMRDAGNPWGERLDLALGSAVDARYFVPEAQAVVFAGCQAIRAADDHLKPLFSLFERLGVDHVGMYGDDPLCCGLPLWQAGDVDGFLAHARRLAGRLGRVRQVICPCPSCAWVLGGLLPTVGVSLSAEVITIDEFLGPRVASRPPAAKLSAKVACHDPCFLTRYLERGHSYRDLIGAVLAEPALEPHWSGDDALCCGGGGLVPHTLPHVARAVADRSMETLRASGAERVVTACPGCVRQLREADGGLPVVDLVQLILEAYS